MKRYLVLISVLFALLSVSVFAADVDVTISSTSASPGDEVAVTFSMESKVLINSIAFSDFVYDETALELLSFEGCDDLSGLTQFATFDKERMAVVIGFKKKATHCVDVFTATFKVKDTAKNGDYTVSAVVTTKNSSTILSNSVTPGTIKISPVAVKGTSLVLDGSIGVKTYFDFSDVIDVSGTVAETVIYDTAIKENVFEETSSLAYDSEKGLYYTVAYIAPKDIDNRTIIITVKYKVKGSDDVYALQLEPITVEDYISEFKSLAEEQPDSEYGKALDLVEKMETYTKFADKYFGGETLEDVTADTDAIEAVSDAKATGTVSGIQLYATSLILEDKTTIRHYFSYTGDYTKHTFKMGDKTLNPVKKGDFIYVDIENIVAQDMDNIYTLEVSDAMTIDYSVLNYVKLAVKSADARISNLVKALFNYYQQAEAYAK